MVQTPADGRVLWTGSPPNGEVPRQPWSDLIPVALGAALGAAIFMLAARLNPLRTPVAWIVVVFFSLPVLSRAWQRLTASTPRDVRYTLTERGLIVESSDGRHVYDLAALGELTVDVERSGLGSIYFRRPEPIRDQSEGYRRFMATLGRLGLLPSPAGHALIAAVPDAPAVLRLILEARSTLAPAPSVQVADAVPSAVGVDGAAATTGVTKPTYAPPPIWVGLPFIVMGGFTALIAIAAGREPHPLLFLFGLAFLSVGVAVVFFAIRAGFQPKQAPLHETPTTPVKRGETSKPSGAAMLMTAIPPYFGLIGAASGIGFTVVALLSSAPPLVILFPLLFALAGGAMAYGSISSWLTAGRLRMRGQATIGTVTGVVDANLEVNDAPQYHVAYRYRSVEGTEHEGYSRPMPKADADRWGIGDQIEVRYDATRPERSVGLDEA